MRKLHKGLIIGGTTLAVLVPAGFVAADQFGNGMGNGNGNGAGHGNGTMTQDRTPDCTQDQIMDQVRDRIQARDGTGENHEAIANTIRTENTIQTQTQAHNGEQGQSGYTNGEPEGPQDGTGEQNRNGR